MRGIPHSLLHCVTVMENTAALIDPLICFYFLPRIPWTCLRERGWSNLVRKHKHSATPLLKRCVKQMSVTRRRQRSTTTVWIVARATVAAVKFLYFYIIEDIVDGLCTLTNWSKCRFWSLTGNKEAFSPRGQCTKEQLFFREGYSEYASLLVWKAPCIPHKNGFLQLFFWFVWSSLFVKRLTKIFGLGSFITAVLTIIYFL